MRSFLSSRAPLLLSIPILLVFAVAVWQMQTATPAYPLRAKLFPLLVAVPMLLIAVYQVLMDLRARRPSEEDAAPDRGIPASIEVEEYAPAFEETAKPTAAQLRQGMLWFAAFFVAVWALGFLIAIPLFTFTYFVVAGGDRWYWGVLGAVVIVGFLYGMFDQWLHIPLLRGAVFALLQVG